MVAGRAVDAIVAALVLAAALAATAVVLLGFVGVVLVARCQGRGLEAEHLHLGVGDRGDGR